MIELGPESYLGRKTIMTELAKDIGLEQDIVTNTTGQSYIFCEKQIVSYSRWINYGNSDRYQTVCDN
ncbi:Protoporphyrinogen IX oxidase, aerobic [Staphylococcus aureus]|uniref:Protoporphyrinogen IX oxidase, aerobic n=1 Tax=Staphylococcus aureus TaxID=1280 RepID=A0A380DVM8_STAAU|nr:Protoporphyrinogen IX oxidase, aerobic [Staphylococcus aureus]